MSSTVRTMRNKWTTVGLWGLIVFEILGIGLAGVAKFQGDSWQVMFTGWGYTAWFATLVGALEVGGALLLTIRKLASYGAALLIAIMLGAIWTVTTRESQLGAGIPAIHISLLTVILWARWSDRWLPGGTRRPSQST